jgi:hypothetical protein
MFAHQHLAAEGRMDAVWSMILLTDGRADGFRDCPDCPPPLDCQGAECNTCAACPAPERCVNPSHACAGANGWAMDHAADTWDRHETSIYTIAYGQSFTEQPAFRDLMIWIADRTDNGLLEGSTENFWLAPDEASLRVAFQQIAERIYTRLLR